VSNSQLDLFSSALGSDDCGNRSIDCAQYISSSSIAAGMETFVLLLIVLPTQWALVLVVLLLVVLKLLIT
jgi:hypothetical protein